MVSAETKRKATSIKAFELGNRGHTGRGNLVTGFSNSALKLKPVSQSTASWL